MSPQSRTLQTKSPTLNYALNCTVTALRFHIKFNHVFLEKEDQPDSLAYQISRKHLLSMYSSVLALDIFEFLVYCDNFLRQLESPGASASRGLTCPKYTLCPPSGLLILH